MGGRCFGGLLVACYSLNSVVVRTWDDMPDWIYRRVSDCQRKAVNLLLGDGYEIRQAWPDLNYEAFDRIIIMTEKEIETGKVAVTYVDVDGRVNCVDPYSYLAAEDYCWKEPKPLDVPYPNAPEDYALTGPDLEFVERARNKAEALACVRFAAAINSGPPKWITRQLSENIRHEGDSCYASEGREAVERILISEVNWKRFHREKGRLLFAELGHAHKSGNPCVVLLFLQVVDGIRIPPERRRYMELFMDAFGMIGEVRTTSWDGDLQSCELTGIRPGLTEIP